MWFSGGHIRREKRRQRKEIKSLEKELNELRIEEPSTVKTPETELFPKLLSGSKTQ